MRCLAYFGGSMDQKDRIARIVCYGIVALIAYQLLIRLLPVVMAVLAMVGAGYLFYEYQRRRG